jgi:hypothetical protein
MATQKKARPTLHTRGGKIVSPADPPTVAAPRAEMIAVAAYFLAEKRNFAGGSELDDWLTAEREIDAAQPGAGGNADRG